MRCNIFRSIFSTTASRSIYVYTSGSHGFSRILAEFWRRQQAIGDRVVETEGKSFVARAGSGRGTFFAPQEGLNVFLGTSLKKLFEMNQFV